ncbi:MAG: hypothetical protein P8177_05085 [Gemmatimonadota bacterium]
MSVDLAWLPYSEKGARPPADRSLAAPNESIRRRAWVVVACDPSGASFARHVGEIRPGWKQLGKVLGGRIEKGSRLLYRVNQRLRIAPLARCFGLGSENERAASTVPRRDPERARVWLARCRRWAQRFRGTATRYLDNYLTWFRLVDIAKERVRPRRELDVVLAGRFPDPGGFRAGRIPG